MTSKHDCSHLLLYTARSRLDVWYIVGIAVCSPLDDIGIPVHTSSDLNEVLSARDVLVTQSGLHKWAGGGQPVLYILGIAYCDEACHDPVEPEGIAKTGGFHLLDGAQGTARTMGVLQRKLLMCATEHLNQGLLCRKSSGFDRGD